MTLYVTNLPAGVGAAELARLFVGYGRVARAEIWVGSNGRTGQWSGVIDMHNGWGAAVVALHGRKYRGHTLGVGKIRPGCRPKLAGDQSEREERASKFYGGGPHYTVKALDPDDDEEVREFEGGRAFTRASECFEKLKADPGFRELWMTRLDGVDFKFVARVRRAADGGAWVPVPFAGK